MSMQMRKLVRSPRAISVVVLATVVVIAAACHHTRGEGIESAVGPHIDRIRPDSIVVAGGALVDVAVLGRGFAPGNPGMNTVEFEGMLMSNVAANATGTEVRFTIPQAIVRPGEAPPRSLDPGDYRVRIVTARGTSNPITIHIYR